MGAADTPAGDRLSHALTQAGVSVSELARRLADRPDIHASADSLRRDLSRYRAGTLDISPERQAAIEGELGLPAGYLFTESVTAIRQREFERRLSELERLSEWMRARLVELLAAIDALADAQKGNTELVNAHGTLLAEIASRLEKLEGTQGAGGTLRRE